MGVGALTASAIKCILHVFPDAKISLLDYGRESAIYHVKEGNRAVDIELLNMRFSKNVLLRNHIAFLIFTATMIKMIPTRALRERIIYAVPILRAMYQTDVFISVAGGDSFSDIYGMQRFFYITLPQHLVLLLNKELILFPQTIGPFGRKISRYFAKHIMKRSRLIYSRDPEGITEAGRILRSVDKIDKVRQCYDLGFVLDPEKPSTMDIQHFSKERCGDRLVVGLNVSGLLLMGGYTQDNMFGLKLDYRDLIYSAIDHLIRQRDAVVLLIPHVFGTDVRSESDSVACASIFNELHIKYGDRIYFARGRYCQNEIKYIIGLCDFFIGSRMHACIAALSQCIPAVSVSYSRKFVGVMETIGVAELVIDPRDHTEQEVINRIDAIMQKREEFKQILEYKMPHVKRSILDIGRALS